MTDPTDLLDKDCEIASDLKQLLLEELGNEVELDETAVDAVARGIAALLQSP